MISVRAVLLTTIEKKSIINVYKLGVHGVACVIRIYNSKIIVFFGVIVWCLLKRELRASELLKNISEFKFHNKSFVTLLVLHI